MVVSVGRSRPGRAAGRCQASWNNFRELRARGLSPVAWNLPRATSTGHDGPERVIQEVGLDMRSVLVGEVLNCL